MKSFRDGRVKGWQGVPIHYRMYGEGEPALVCCNGLGVSTFFWKYIVRYFSDQYRVVTWDYRGHARSGFPKKMVRENFTVAANSKDLLAVLDDCGITKAVILGHSMGCQVVLDFWRRYPDRVAAMIPICGSYGRPIDRFFDSPRLWRPIFDVMYLLATNFPDAFEAVNRPLLKTAIPYEIAKYSGTINPMLATRDDLRPYFEHLSVMNQQVFFFMAGEMQRHSAKAWLKKIDVPVLVVGGEIDRFTPLVISVEMRDEIPDAELLVLPKGGHTGIVEYPELINLRVEKFLAERVFTSTSREKSGRGKKKVRSESLVRKQSGRRTGKNKKKSSGKGSPQDESLRLVGGSEPGN